MWSSWVFSTFIMDKKNRYRLLISVISLVTIILSVHSIKVYHMEISLAAIFLLLVSYCFFIRKNFLTLINVSLKMVIASISIATFQLLALYDPVWIVVDLIWLLSIFSSILVLFLFNQYKEQLTTIIIGMIQGEIIFALILSNLNIHYPIASLAFFDALCISCFLITVRKVIISIPAYFDMKNLHLEKEKEL